MRFEHSVSAIEYPSLLEARFKQVTTHFDSSHEVLWTYINQPNAVPCFNGGLLDDLYHHHDAIAKTAGTLKIGDETHRIRYSVLASKTPGYFNMGGDLKKMAEAIRQQNRAALESYAKRSVDVVAQRTFRFDIPRLTTISLLQGETLGAGIEAAMTSDIMIAERQSVLCFPEMFFNMIPGMGAYSFISRKAGMEVADKMIMGCERYTAEECFEMGIIDILADEGQGEQAVYEFIDKQRKRAEGFISAQKAKKYINPVTYQELNSIVAEWVENALALTERDLKVMDRFLRAQEKLFSQVLPSNVATFKPISHETMDINRVAVNG